MKIAVIYLLFASHFVLAKAQYISDKPCPVRPFEQNFDIKKYAGVWYTLMRYERLNSKGCDCSFADYDFLEDNSISFRHCCKKLPNTKLGCGTGKIVLSYPDQSVIEGKMNISYGSMPSNESNYWILSTDYDNYAIVYNCKNIDDTKSQEYAWLFSRKTEIDQMNTTAKSTANALIDAYFDRSQMYQSDQSAERCDPRFE